MDENKWKVVRYNKQGEDTRKLLESLGFTNIELEFSYQPDHKVLLYDATPPAGWTKRPHAFTTDFLDEKNVMRAQMYYRNTGIFELDLQLVEETVVEEETE